MPTNEDQDMSDSITVEILKEIRDTGKAANEQIAATNRRIDRLTDEVRESGKATNERIDRLERRQVETEVRLSTELVAVTAAVYQVRDAILEDRALRTRVSDLESRVTTLERKAG